MKKPYPASVFKAYDIRGTVPDLIDARFARALGFALAGRARQAGNTELVVGYDGRLSSPELAVALQEGLLEGGVNTLDIGRVPTPLVYFGAYTGQLGAGVAITGSHNPPKYNGFKMMLGGRALYGDDVQSLRQDMDAPEGLSATRPGTRRSVNLVPDYIKRIVSDIKLARPMKIAIDCGNGVAGAVAPQLFRALGCEVTELFCEVDGNFPNHHPDPADPHNLQDLIHCLATTDCEIGLAFDGDGDRLGVVTKSGQIIWPDRQLILFARDVLQRCPGETIIYDVKCSRHVGLAVAAAGGKPLMWQTGHSLVKAKLAETGAPLAGEMSGHIFFKERWYGFDDGIYSAARLLEIISLDKRDSEHVFSAFPLDVSTPEINITVTDESKFALIEALQRDGQWGEANLTTLDGVRVDYPKGWGLVRASNTTPVLVLRFEADSEAELERIKDVFRNQLKAVDPALTIPF